MLFVAALIGAVMSLRPAIRSWRESSRARRAVLALTPIGLAALAIAAAPRGYLLTKSIGLMVMPLGLIWMAALVVAIAAWWRGRRDVAITGAAFFAALTLVGSAPIAGLLTRAVEGAHRSARPLEGEAPFDAVIVLGGGTGSTPRGEAQLGDSGDRVLLGARLYRRGRTPLLVTSGSAIPGVSTHDSVAATARIWRELGIPAGAIVEVEGARTTSEEARLHAALVRERGWRRVGLVTSARHLPRALGLFRAEGLAPTPLPADVEGETLEWRGLYDLVPNGGAAASIHAACWELVGRLAGR